MNPKLALAAALVGSLALTACGTSTAGSKHNTMHGVTDSGYPAGHPRDSGSPALASSQEVERSHEGPKLPKPITSTGPVEQPPLHPDVPNNPRQLGK